MPVTIQAHRGSPDRARGIGENTLEAFARARELGADGVELDVRMTADGELAVHHDPVVPDAGAVAGLAARELPAHVPLLAAALEACTGMVVNIEIKNSPSEPGHDPTEAAALAVAATVAAAGVVDEVVVSSFWLPSLDAVRSARPAIATGLLLASWFDADDGVALARDHGCAAVHPHVSLVTAPVVQAAHAAGMGVAAWTADDRPTMRAMAAYGVDTVITDDVALAVSLLRSPTSGRD